MPNINNLNLFGTNYGIQGAVDNSLTTEGLAADAKAVGDALTTIRAQVGAPLVASTSSAMTDRTRIYVYTGTQTGYTKGNWYYYNGSAWVSGGVYNSTAVQTDKSLSVSDMAADAGVTGAMFQQINAGLGNPNRFTPSWQRKTINGTSGIESNSTTRISTIDFMPYPGVPVTITPGAGLRFSIRTYTSNSYSTITGTTDWMTAPYVLSTTSNYFKVVVSYPSDAEIQITEGENMTIAYYTYTDKSLTIDGKAADAKAVGDALELLIGTSTVDATWIQGTIDSHTGAGGTGTSRIHTTEYYKLDSNAVTVSAPSNYKFGIRVYSGDTYDTYIEAESSTIWYYNTQIFDVVPGRYVRFVAAYTSDENISPSAGASISLTYQKANIVTHNGVVTRNDPDNMLVKIQQLCRPTRISGTNFGQAPLCILHFSDIHGDARCLQNVIDFKKYYSDWITDILHSGDTIRDNLTQDNIDFWNETAGAEKILNCIGNHDTSTWSGSRVWVAQTMAESYQMYFAPYISNWGVTYTANKTYYYKDYSTQKVRLIVLDIMHQDATQLSWFTSTLNSARTAGLHVIAVCHGRSHWKYDALTTAWDDWKLVPGYSADNYTDTSSSSYPENMADGYASAVDSFISAGGNFICWLHGHTHFKMLAKLRNHPNQVDVAVANAGGTDYANTYVWARFRDSKSEDDFNLFAVDTYSKVFRMAKVGVNYDRYMRYVDTVCYDYGNRVLI